MNRYDEKRIIRSTIRKMNNNIFQRIWYLSICRYRCDNEKLIKFGNFWTVFCNSSVVCKSKVSCMPVEDHSCASWRWVVCKSRVSHIKYFIFMSHAEYYSYKLGKWTLISDKKLNFTEEIVGDKNFKGALGLN